jgi:hypothetical protein
MGIVADDPGMGWVLGVSISQILSFLISSFEMFWGLMIIMILSHSQMFVCVWDTWDTLPNWSSGV